MGSLADLPKNRATCLNRSYYPDVRALMLIGLRIENFALIDQLELDLGSGLTVLTGETGAGKSIILDAIDAALGGKVSSRAIRTGSVRSLVEASFKVSAEVVQWLATQEIDLLDGDTVVCSRELATQQGSLRSRSRINGILVNRQFMDQLRDRLVEITAQGQTVQLMAPAQQRELLDLYGGTALLQQKKAVAHAFEKTSHAWQALEKRRQSEQQRLQRLDLLEYQAKELGKAQLTTADEPELLLQEQERLSHVVELQQMSYQVYQILYQNEAGDDLASCADLLGQAEITLSKMVEFDGQLQPLLDLVSGAIAQVVEAGQQIHTYGGSLEADPQRLGEVEERQRILKQICRKYGPTLADAIAYQETITAELAELQDSGQSIEELEKTYQLHQEQLKHLCAELTQLRQTAAEQLETQLVRELRPLAMEKVQFQVKITPCDPGPTGADTIVFYFSPNPGEPLQPLAATASGGEMSRFLLALKSCFSQVEASSRTLIFDEIDVGVSGRVAQAIADKLHQLGDRHQVLCVTHQPLVAALADRHFRVDKQVINPNESTDLDVRTVVRIRELADPQMRRDELAQLAGGQSAADATAFAESLLTRARNGKRPSL